MRLWNVSFLFEIQPALYETEVGPSDVVWSPRDHYMNEKPASAQHPSPDRRIPSEPPIKKLAGI